MSEENILGNIILCKDILFYIFSQNFAKYKQLARGKLGGQCLFQLRVNLSHLRDTKDAIIRLVTPLRYASVVKVLEILSIYYLNVLVMHIIEQPWQLGFAKKQPESSRTPN